MLVEMTVVGIQRKEELPVSESGLLLSTDLNDIEISWKNLYRLLQLPSVMEEMAAVEMNPKASPL